MKKTPIITWTGKDFRAHMARELICPHCFRPLHPSGVRREPEVINLICERCHQDVLSIELSLRVPVL
jgi:hypothetical protein